MPHPASTSVQTSRSRGRRHLLAAVAFGMGGVVLSAVAMAGTVLSYSARGECRGEIETAWIQGSQFRVDGGIDGLDYSTLYDGGERVTTALMHDQRQYFEMEVDEDALDYQADVAYSGGNFIEKQMDKAQAQMKAQCEQMERQGMPCPEMSTDMQGMMSGMMASQLPTWRNLGRGGEVGGVACQWWERGQGGVKLREECRAGISDLRIAERDRRGFAKGIAVMERYAGGMQGMSRGITGQDPAHSNPPPDTLVLEQICFDATGNESGHASADFADSIIDESVFAIPDGYTRMSMDGAQPAE